MHLHASFPGPAAAVLDPLTRGGQAAEAQAPGEPAFDPVLAVRVACRGERGGTVGTRVGALYGGLSLRNDGRGAWRALVDTVHY